MVQESFKYNYEIACKNIQISNQKLMNKGTRNGTRKLKITP